MEKQSAIPIISNALYSAFESYMSSEIFELEAQGGVRFFVHKDILAHQSQPFANATDGVWTESTERKINLEDWDAKTVGRLVQFLYTGDYKYPGYPLSEIPEEPTVKEQSAPKSPEDSELFPGTLTPSLERVLGTSATPRITDSTWLELVDTSNFDFEETLLAHAKVYALAHYKSITMLKALAQERLSSVLFALHPLNHNPHLPTNIVSLATYVYENTDSLANSAEPLRNIVSNFVVLNFPAWQAHPEAVEMMCGGGDFVRDVLTKICRRLGNPVVLSVATPTTRFISTFSWRVSGFRNQPAEYAPQLDSKTGEVMQTDWSGWLIPRYASGADTATTHFYLTQTAGLSVEAITGVPCGLSCHIHRGFSEGASERIVAIALVRCPDGVFQMGRFPDYNGVLSHCSHSASDAGSTHILWRTVRILPA